MEPKNRWWSLAIVIFLMVVGIYLFAKSRQAGVDARDQAPGVVQGRTNRLSVNEQEANTLTANIDSASLSAPGFIAIHKDSGGSSGADIAASELLQAGIHSDVNVITSLVPGKTYWAMLHLDN